MSRASRAALGDWRIITDTEERKSGPVITSQLTLEELERYRNITSGDTKPSMGTIISWKKVRTAGRKAAVG